MEALYYWFCALNTPFVVVPCIFAIEVEVPRDLDLVVPRA
jgi:hypothetical protein